jgi:hypothetical protein
VAVSFEMGCYRDLKKKGEDGHGKVISIRLEITHVKECVSVC